MVYVLLLRGINVGGKNRVSMSDLKKALSEEGFEDVDSYINSGNLFFSSAESIEHCLSKIARMLERNYDFSIPFYCCPVNFTTTHFPYPQRPSIGVADSFFEK